jgi:hypothetical protein
MGTLRGSERETAVRFVAAPLAGQWWARAMRALTLGERWHAACLPPERIGDVQPRNTGRSWTGDLSHGQISIPDAS